MNPPVKILFVENEQGIRELFGLIFASNEYEVKVVEDGQNGLDALSKGEYDVVVSDLGMSGISGEKFLEEVAARYPRVERIVCTGRINDPSEAETMRTELGLNAVIAKPWKNKDLENIIKKAAEKKRESEKTIEGARK